MLIWSLIIVCLLVFGGIGFGAGAIAASLMLLGVLIGSVLAVPLGKAFVPILGLMGVKNIVWAPMLAPLIPQVLLVLIFLGVGLGVHFAYFKKQKFTKDDLTILRMRRVTRRTGLLFGLLAGVLVFFPIGKFIYSNGYIAAQMSSDEAPGPGWFRMLASARKDMEATSMDKVFATMDRTPAKYYAWCDMLGLVSSNPAITNRMFIYPGLMTFGERPDVQETVADADYMALVFTKGSLPALIDHSRTQGFITSSEIIEKLEGLDLADFRTFLETGKSPKYAEEKAVGLWTLDKESTLTSIKKRRPEMKAVEILALRALLGKMPETTLMLSPDNKSLIKVSGGVVETPAPAAEAEAPAPPVQQRGTTGPGDSFSMAKRMARQAAGQPLPQQGGARRPVAAAAGSAVTKTSTETVQHLVPQYKGEGTWSSGIASYEVTVQDSAGKPVKMTGKVDENELTVAAGEVVLVFQRVM